MSEKKRNLLFSVLTVVVTAAIFFALGFTVAHRYDYVENKVVVGTLPSEATTTSAPVVLIDLNMATVEELMTVSGIGEKTAQNIIAYREEIGGYEYVEQLQYVKGIGETRYRSWLPYFTVNGVGHTVTTMANTESRSTTSVTTTSTVDTGKFHLNRVTKEELLTINGVGEKTAEAILQYREQIGGFTEMEQLLEVDGIGDKRYAVLCEYLTLTDE